MNTATAQNPLVTNINLHGIVIDSESRLPLVGVHVYYDGTSIGDVSDLNGKFSLPVLKDASIPVILSMIGYLSSEINLKEDSYNIMNIIIRMVPQSQRLDEILIEGEYDEEWEEQLKLFTKYFFGDTPFGVTCELLSPELLEFNYEEDGKILVATSDVSVKYLNKALGYLVEISNFSMVATDEFLQWKGYTRFQELVADSISISQYSVNRLSAYKGSFKHFLSELVSGEFTVSEYKAFHVPLPRMDWTNVPIWEQLREEEKRSIDKQLSQEPVVRSLEKGEIYSIQVPKVLYVRYFGEELSPKYDPSYGGASDHYQSSWIVWNGAQIQVNRNGDILSIEGDIVPIKLGYMAWERAGEILPKDYMPPKLE